MVGDLATRTGSIIFKGIGMRLSSNNVLAVPVVTGDVATTALSSTNIPTVIPYFLLLSIGIF